MSVERINAQLKKVREQIAQLQAKEKDLAEQKHVPIRRGPVLGDGGHLHMDNATKLEWCKDFPKLAKRIKPIVS